MSAETRTTSSTGGQKGVKLERFDLIPVGPLTALATHFGRGARKYDDNQWRKGYEWSKSYAAKQRHDNLFWAGFDYDVCENDPEGCSFVDQHGEPFEQFESEHGHGCYNHTTSHHLDASNWHGFVLREFTVTHPEHDDRYTTTVREQAELSEEIAAPPEGYVRRWIANYDAERPPPLRPFDIWTIPEAPRFGTGRMPCDVKPVFYQDGDPRFAEENDGRGDAVIVGDHEFDPDTVFEVVPIVRFVAGAAGVEDLQPERTFYEVMFLAQSDEELIPEFVQRVNDAINRRAD